MNPRDAKILDAFYAAACFLKEKVDHDGWTWRSNFLREYVGARFHIKFSNSESPELLRMLVRAYPEFETYVVMKPRKGN